MMSLVLLGFVDFKTTEKGRKVNWSWKPIIRLKQFSKYSHFLVITLYFWIVLFSFWQVEGDYNYFLERLRIKVPFLLIPLAYLGLPRLGRLSFQRILYFFLSMMTISVVGVLTLYLANFEEVNLLLKKGQHIVAPCNHIRYSLLVGLGVLAGWYLIKNQFSKGIGFHSIIIKVLTAILFVSIHILSVKTGMVCLYAALFVLAIRQIYTTRNYSIGVAILATMIVLPWVAFKTIPSFSEKVHYTLYDLQMYDEGQGSNYGDSGRITSLKVGVDLFKKAPVFGVGAGSLKVNVESEFDTNYPHYQNALMPHSQFMFVLAGSGLLGVMFFTLALFIPLLYQRAYQNDFYLGFYILFLVSFLIEHTIENALGVGMFSSFILLCLLYIHNENRLIESDS